MAKRLLDILASAAALVIGAPILLLIALVVLATMGRPVLFRQQRPGLHGKPFQLLKFRTMRNDARLGTDVASDGQRLTRTGRFLRATSLDELPELWNVLRGDMSLVGPRPLLMQYLDRYTPEQARRHAMRPGITGLAQVRGYRGETTDIGKMMLRVQSDIEYINNWSLWADLAILVRTAGALTGKNAY